MNQIDLEGKTAVVTGGARGIGYAIVERFLASGAKCSLWDLDHGALEEAAANLSKAGEVVTQTVDLTDAAAVSRAAGATRDTLGSIDILVNNAGIAGAAKTAWECTPEEWHQVIEVDLYSVFHCCHAIVPMMLEQGWGRIVSIASIAGKEGNPNASHYSAAKAGVIGFCKSLAKELSTKGILVNCVTPAVIKTDILKQLTQEHIDYMRSKIPMDRFGDTSEVAALIAWLASPDCSFSTGAVFDISGGRATY